METQQISVFNFSLSIFSVFQFYPSFKGWFDSKCNNLGNDLIENFRNLETDFIDFIAWSEYKEVWHEWTSYFDWEA